MVAFRNAGSKVSFTPRFTHACEFTIDSSLVRQAFVKNPCCHEYQASLIAQWTLETVTYT